MLPLIHREYCGNRSRLFRVSVGAVLRSPTNKLRLTFVIAHIPRPTKSYGMLIAEREEKSSPNGSGFPSGCFILRSVSSKRLLDATSHSVQDSAPIILWPEKDNSLIEGKSSTHGTGIRYLRMHRFAPTRIWQSGEEPRRASVLSPMFTISEGFLHRQQRNPLRPRIRTRT